MLYCLLEMINFVCGDCSLVVDISFLEIEKFDCLLELCVEGLIVFVFIMEGCNKYCIYCVVFYICGEEVSCLFDDILFEIVQFVVQGVCEVNLFGQNVNVWCGENYDGIIGLFVDLLCLVVVIDGIDCICFIISYLIEFIDDIIEVYCDMLELVSFLYLLVQSGFDCILNLMGCIYMVLEYKVIICKLCVVCLDIQISFDFIVGFSGEIIEDFEKMMKLIVDVNFDMSYSFIFFVCLGILVVDMVDDVSEEEKKQCLYIL